MSADSERITRIDCVDSGNSSLVERGGNYSTLVRSRDDSLTVNDSAPQVVKYWYGKAGCNQLGCRRDDINELKRFCLIGATVSRFRAPQLQLDRADFP